MTEDDLAAACLARPGAIEEMPFGDGARVFKVQGKMFALVVVGAEPGRICLKCEPEYALELRAQYRSVTGAFHFNKKHWNEVDCDGEVPEDEVVELIAHAYERVVAALPRRLREQIS